LDARRVARRRNNPFRTLGKCFSGRHVTEIYVNPKCKQVDLPKCIERTSKSVSLPGCNLVQDGPDEAVPGHGCGGAGPSNDTASEAPEISPASLPSAQSLASSPASSTNATLSSTTASQMLRAASGSTTHVTVSITKVHSITTTSVVAPESSTIYGPSRSTSKGQAHPRRHIDGQHVYWDDLRWRKHVREGWVW
jgi:hypothetical protein